MELANRSVIITGGASGIGAGMARRFGSEGAKVLVADLDGDGADAVAAEIGGVGMRVDVTSDADNRAMVEAAEEAHGPVDLLCLNAGIGTAGSVDAPDDDWQRTWDVNVMAHVYGARAVLPSMIDRGEGYLLVTASAAGLLTNLGAAPYSVTKHAAVALAEWLAITYGDLGIRVSCLCPQFVRTQMVDDLVSISDGFADWARATSLSVEEVADAVVAGLRAERFLILPHPEVGEYFVNKATDYDRWLAGMRKIQAKYEARPSSRW